MITSQLKNLTFSDHSTTTTVKETDLLFFLLFSSALQSFKNDYCTVTEMDLFRPCDHCTVTEMDLFRPFINDHFTVKEMDLFR